MVANLDARDWDTPEVFGWLYESYNAELKDDFFSSKRKAAAADIAPATQLFTPEWIVRYMVENSLGACGCSTARKAACAGAWNTTSSPTPSMRTTCA